MTTKSSELLRVFYQRQFRWTRFGNGWVVLRPWMRIAPFFLFGLTHVSDDSPISVLVVNLGVWSMLEAAYRSGVLSWRYFEKEEFLLRRRTLWSFYFSVGAIEATTVVPLVLVAGVVEGSVTQLTRALLALPIMALVFCPYVIALGDVSQRISTKFWDLKFIGGYVISSLIFTAPVLRPFQSAWGTEILAWNPIGLPFWFGRSYVLSGTFSAPEESIVSFSVLVVAIVAVVAIRERLHGNRRSTLRDLASEGVPTSQSSMVHSLDEDFEPMEMSLPSQSEARFQVGNQAAGIDLMRVFIEPNHETVIRRDDDVRIGIEVFNHSVSQSTYPRVHVHKHDGKHIFSLEWPDGEGLHLPQGRITQFSTRLAKFTLGPGSYFLSVDICTYDPFRRFLSTPPIVRFEVVDLELALPETQRSPHNRKGYFQPQPGWRAQSFSIDEYKSHLAAMESAPSTNE